MKKPNKRAKQLGKALKRRKDGPPPKKLSPLKKLMLDNVTVTVNPRSGDETVIRSLDGLQTLGPIITNVSTPANPTHPLLPGINSRDDLVDCSLTQLTDFCGMLGIATSYRATRFTHIELLCEALGYSSTPESEPITAETLQTFFDAPPDIDDTTDPLRRNRVLIVCDTDGPTFIPPDAYIIVQYRAFFNLRSEPIIIDCRDMPNLRPDIWLRERGLYETGIAPDNTPYVLAARHEPNDPDFVSSLEDVLSSTPNPNPSIPESIAETFGISLERANEAFDELSKELANANKTTQITIDSLSMLADKANVATDVVTTKRGRRIRIRKGSAPKED